MYQMDHYKFKLLQFRCKLVYRPLLCDENGSLGTTWIIHPLLAFLEDMESLSMVLHFGTVIRCQSYTQYWNKADNGASKIHQLVLVQVVVLTKILQVMLEMVDLLQIGAYPGGSNSAGGNHLLWCWWTNGGLLVMVVESITMVAGGKMVHKFLVMDLVVLVSKFQLHARVPYIAQTSGVLIGYCWW